MSGKGGSGGGGGGGPGGVYDKSDEVTIGLIVSTALSIVGCLLVIFTYVRWRRLRRHPASLVVVRSLLDLLFCAEMLGNHLYHRAGNVQSDDISDCKEFSFISQFLTMAAELFGLMLSLDLYFSVSNPFANYRANLKMYHAFAWTVSIVLATLVLVITEDGKPIYARDPYLDICWIKRSSGGDGSGAGSAGHIDIYFLSLFVLPVVGIYSASVVVLLLAQRRLAHGLPGTFEARLQVFRSSMRFALSYILYWVTAGAVYGILALVTDEAPTAALDLVLAFALGSRGVVTFGVWMITWGQTVRCSRWGFRITGQTTSSRAPIKTVPGTGGGGGGGRGDRGDGSGSGGGAGRGLFLDRNGSLRADVGFFDDDSADLRPHLNVALRREILYYATLGIAKSAARAAADPSTDGTRAGGSAFNKIHLSRQYEETGLFALEKSKLGIHRTASTGAALSGLGASASGAAAATAAAAASARSGRAAAAAAKAALQEPLLAGADGRTAYGGAGGTMSLNGGGRRSLSGERSAGGQRGAGVGGLLGMLGVSASSSSSSSSKAGAAAAGAGEYTPLGSPEAPSPSASPSPTSGLPAPRQSAQQWLESAVRDAGEERAASAVAEAAEADARRAGRGSGVGGRLARTLSGSRSGLLGGPAVPLTPLAAAAIAAGGGGAAPPDDDSAYTFFDFEPHMFSRMRRLHGISDEDYIASLSRTRRERFSEGASGAFLYYSLCDRFIVKTMTKPERDVLLGMLGDYVTYMERHPHSLLARYYGCHALRMYGKPIYFVVMQNMLASHGATIHERYDLKGSWVNRHSVALERGHKTECRHCGQAYKVGRKAALNQCPARPNQEHEPTQTMRDSDWAYKLRLATETAQALGDMIVRDTEFLRRHTIMDYSLLLGIHRNKYRLVETAPPAAAAQGSRPGGSVAGFGSSAASASAAAAAAGRATLFRQESAALLEPLHPDDDHHHHQDEKGAGAAAGGPPHMSLADGRQPRGAGGGLPLRGTNAVYAQPLPARTPHVGAAAAGKSVPGSMPTPLILPSRAPGADDEDEDGLTGLADDTDTPTPTGPTTIFPMTPVTTSLHSGGAGGGAASMSVSPRGAAGGRRVGAAGAAAAVPIGAPVVATEVLHEGPAPGDEEYEEEEGEDGGGAEQHAARPQWAGGADAHAPVAAMSSSSSSAMRPSPAWSSGSGSNAGAGSGAGSGSSSSSGHPPTRPSPLLHPSIQLRYEDRLHNHVQPFFSQHRGGMRSVIVEGPGLYYVGIIDMLQKYTLSKRLENWFKTRLLCRPTDGISCIPPNSYAERFRRRVIGQLIEGYEAAADWECEEEDFI
jgi:hypothetical protein